MKKYELTNDIVQIFGKTLHRIKALRDFGDVNAGGLGGYIETESNLSHDDTAWVSGDAMAYDNARVYGNARVSGNARVYGNAVVSGNALVSGDARVYNNAWVYGNAGVCGDALVYGDAWVYNNAVVSGNALVSGDARVSGNARVSGDAWVSGNAGVYGNAKIYSTHDYSIVGGFGSVSRTTTFFRCTDGLVRTYCGCFYGTLDEFREKVKETHGNSKFAKEYLAIADLMEMHFKEEQ